MLEADLVRAYEAAAQADAIERPLILLRQAGLLGVGDAPERWTIGQRDACLIALHEMTFGPRIVGTAHCGACSEQLQVEFDLDAIRSPSVGGGSVEVVAVDSTRLQVRLPTSDDLRLTRDCNSAEEAATALAQICLVDGDDGRELTANLLDAIDGALSANDPQAHVELQARCPGCGAVEAVAFDIADYVWRQVARSARRTLADVHLIASAYGWTEADIMALPAARRQCYLEMIWD